MSARRLTNIMFLTKGVNIACNNITITIIITITITITITIIIINFSTSLELKLEATQPFEAAAAIPLSCDAAAPEVH